MTVRLDLAYALGSSLGTLQTFHELGLMAPYQEPYVPYSVEVEAGDALVYGHGWATTGLHWGFISQTDRNLLKSYCPGKSAIVYIRLRDDDWDWCVCKAVMLWQPETPPITGTIVDFSIKLRILENYGVVTL
jgi:hypothetical protein